MKVRLLRWEGMANVVSVRQNAGHVRQNGGHDCSEKLPVSDFLDA